MATRKGGGAPLHNKNAAGPHNGTHHTGALKPIGSSSRFRSFAVGAAFGGVGSGAHAMFNSSHNKEVRSGMHALGSATGSAVGGAIGGVIVGGPVGAIGGAATGAVFGGVMGYTGSKVGKYVGSHYGTGSRAKKGKR